MKKLLLLFFLSVSALFAEGYVCTNDKAYFDFMEGSSNNIPKQSIYPIESNCLNNCYEYKKCEYNAEKKAHTCKEYSGQIRTGDIGPNFFSDKNKCELACRAQKECIRVAGYINDCLIIDEELSDPVTDWTGKTVFTKKQVTTKCKESQVEVKGCKDYEKVSNSATLNFDLSGIGWRYSTYNGFEDAKANIFANEHIQHLFNGWKGRCEYGLKFSNPFSDPMNILSYAMSIYSMAGEGMLGENMKAAHKAVSDSFDGIVGSSVSGSEGALVKGGQKVGGLSDELSNLNEIWSGTVGGVKLTLKWTAVLNAAAAIAFPPEEDFQRADGILKAWMGDSDQDKASLSYAMCMASIGLSFPNMASWSGGDHNNTSIELQKPYLNPINLTDAQMGILIKATSANFVKKTILPIKTTATSGTYIALTPLAYSQVGQVVCGGKLAIAKNILNHTTTPPPTGSSGQNMGIAAAQLAVSMLPPPYNLVGKLILDILTSFSDGNACTDQEIAIKWGMDQYKTNLHVSFNQCHLIESECVAKFFWGSCMRHENKYCCYDQISTRIIMEGVKQQFGRSWDNCSDISISDIKNITFVPCKSGQNPYKDHCFPADKFNEFMDAMRTQSSKGLNGKSMRDIVGQAINAMAIPGGLAEKCKPTE